MTISASVDHNYGQTEGLKLSLTRQSGYSDTMVGATYTFRLGTSFFSDALVTYDNDSNGGISVTSEAAGSAEILITITGSDYTSQVTESTTKLYANLIIDYAGVGPNQIERYEINLLPSFTA